MSEFFLKIVNMSISASWIVIAVMLLRLLIKKAPKWISVLLWSIVAIRLICPFSIESVMSLIPSVQTINPEIMLDRTPEINTGIPVLNNMINPIVGQSFAPGLGDSANPLQIWIPIMSVVWVVGIAGMLLYTMISYFRVKAKVGTAVLLYDNIYQSENVVSPFVIGIIKPKIYLPFNISDQDMEHVVAHEKSHIHRKDHLLKPIGFLILTLHWFNPFVWIGYVLLCRDIELACDEKVIKELNSEQKADYSQALLSCSVNRRVIAACPLAFGEVGVKDRVKSVLNYKKPAFWIVAAAIVLSIIVAVCFLTNPRTTLNEELSVFIDMQIAEHNYSEEHTKSNFIVAHHKVLGIEESLNKTTVYMWALYNEYSCENGVINNETGSHIPTVITAKRTGKHGHYKLVEYWTPRDGSFYVKDIREKFPWYLQNEALDSQRYIDEQEAFCINAAEEYFASETNGGGIDTNNINTFESTVANKNFYHYFKDEYFARSVAGAMNKAPHEAITEEELASFSGKISVFNESESLTGIGYLKSITELSVAKCPVEEIPNEISQCKKLKRLELLKAYSLKKLPGNIGELKELDYINVALTSLEDIPESIGKLKNLKYLYVSNTLVTAVPKSIGNCESLVILDLHNNNIAKLPDSVVKLKNLKSLDLGKTKITSLPENIGSLSQLVRLDLFGLDLQRLPKSIKKLTKLEYLNVYDNYNLNDEYKQWFENECYKCTTDPENNKDWADGR